MSRSTSRRAPLSSVTPFAPATGAFETPEAAPAITAAGRRKSTGPRAGKKAVPFWIPDAAKRQLGGMAVDEDSTIQALLTEALNDLFKKRGKPPIA